MLRLCNKCPLFYDSLQRIVTKDPCWPSCYDVFEPWVSAWMEDGWHAGVAARGKHMACVVFANAPILEDQQTVNR